MGYSAAAAWILRTSWNESSSGLPAEKYVIGLISHLQGPQDTETMHLHTPLRCTFILHSIFILHSVSISTHTMGYQTEQSESVESHRGGGGAAAEGFSLTPLRDTVITSRATLMRATLITSDARYSDYICQHVQLLLPLPTCGTTHARHKSTYIAKTTRQEFYNS